MYTVQGDKNTRSAAAKCPRGHFCDAGVKRPCPGGTYGDAEGLSTEECSGACEGGYYCPAQSARWVGVGSGGRWERTHSRAHTHARSLARTCSPREFECGAGHFCPPGSGAPVPATVGMFVVGSGPTTAWREQICPAGSYCVDGVEVSACSSRRHPPLARHPPTYHPLQNLCPPATYSSVVGSSNASCEGVCPAGFYCPAGTWVAPDCARERPCAPHAHAHAHPASSPASSSAAQRGCTAPKAPPSPRRCPKGTTASGVRRARAPPGAALSLTLTLARAGDELSRSSVAECPAGSYCAGGVRHPCRGGRYAAGNGSTTWECEGPCEEGHFCPPGACCASIRSGAGGSRSHARARAQAPRPRGSMSAAAWACTARRRARSRRW